MQIAGDQTAGSQLDQPCRRCGDEQHNEEHRRSRASEQDAHHDEAGHRDGGRDFQEDQDGQEVAQQHAVTTGLWQHIPQACQEQDRGRETVIRGKIADLGEHGGVERVRHENHQGENSEACGETPARTDAGRDDSEWRHHDQPGNRVQADERLPAGEEAFGQMRQIERQSADRRREIHVRNLPEADAIGAVEDEDEIPDCPAVGNDMDQCRQRHDQDRECCDRGGPPIERYCRGPDEVVTRFRHIEPLLRALVDMILPSESKTVSRVKVIIEMDSRHAAFSAVSE